MQLSVNKVCDMHNINFMTKSDSLICFTWFYFVGWSISDHILKVDLTRVDLFHSHLESQFRIKDPEKHVRFCWGWRVVFFIPHATSCGGYNVFDPSVSQSVSQSVSPVFLVKPKLEQTYLLGLSNLLMSYIFWGGTNIYNAF